MTSSEKKPLLLDSSSIEVSDLDLTRRIDRTEFSRWHIYVILALGITWVFDGYEVSMLSLASIELKEYFGKEGHEITLIASCYLFGCCCGALFFGFLASKYGRKRLFSITLLIYIFSILGISCSWNYYQLLIFRFMTGLGVGGEYTAIFAAIDELVPPEMRGRVDIILDGSWHFGSFCASIISLLFYWVFTLKSNVWRALFIFGGLGAFPIIHLRSGIPESPRWLIYQGRIKEAEEIIEHIEKCCKANSFSEFKRPKQMEILKGDDNNEEIQCHNDEITHIKTPFSLGLVWDYFWNKYPRRVILGLTMITSQAFFYNGIFYTFALILNEFYGVPKEINGIYMIPLSVASFAGPVFIAPKFDTWGRRQMICISYSLSSVLLALSAILFYYDTLNLFHQCFLWFIVFFIASPGASSAHLTISELFPVEIRSQAMAIFFAIGLGIGGVLAPFLFGILISESSRGYVAIGYLISAFFMLIGGIVGWFYGVQAEGKSLEELRHIS